MINIRKCISCGLRAEKNSFIRVYKNLKKNIFVDCEKNKDGRGAYICNNINCFKNAKKKKKLERAFKNTKINFSEVYLEIEKNIK
ncbi:MAG: DUF448 domain-containing protein [Candidatus Paraimprobicoccus trichonymphae]|uniref:DUF448 domain-containing protein n=1 Tax=Candidatus Paraimprobicoccus trichonymphae TaxID=3033793 RepID=A0AA48IBL0_9FIRM|nr:MAG: DUF448 domain-containing protein [Candidatus Paraimprobicoccus trichonymphae]